MRANRGAILLNGVLIFAAIIVAGLITFQAITLIQYRAIDQKAGAHQARLWAESGLADAINRIRHDPFWRADGTETFPVFEKEKYRVTTSQRLIPNHLLLESAGEDGNFRRRLTQEIIMNIPTLFSVIALENIRISDRALIEGSVSAGQTVIVSGTSRIAGAIQVADHFNGSIRSVHGPIYEKFPQTIFPSLDMSSYSSRGKVRLFGGPISNLAFSDTIVHLTGSADITGLSIMNGTLIVEGDLRILGPCQIEGAGGRIAVIVTGNLTVEDRGSLSLRGPCYVGQTFRSRGTGTVEGTIVAHNVELSSEFRVRPKLETVYTPIAGLPREVLRGGYREEP